MNEPSTLVPDSPSLRFTGRYPDLAALSTGDPVPLRPILDPAARYRLAGQPPPERRTALVIGGNGFVGAHLVARLCAEPGIEAVVAAVRATPGADARQRLAETAHRYRITGIDWDRVTLLDAPVTAPDLGLSPDAYRELADRVDLVFACASSSDYDTGYLHLRGDWFLSLLRVLHFATVGRRKHVTYLGSIGAYFYHHPTDFHRPDSWWYSGYAQMKWVNGQLLRWLAADGALGVTLCEAPYVLGSTRLGLDPAQHYSWWRIIEIAASIGLLWDGPGMCYVPVDVLVDVLTVNALRDRPLPRLLPRNPEPYPNALLADLLGLRLVSWDEFHAEAGRQVSARRMGTLLSENFDALVRRVNAEPLALPPGYTWPAVDNRRLFQRYLAALTLRDVRRREPAVTHG